MRTTYTVEANHYCCSTHSLDKAFDVLFDLADKNIAARLYKYVPGKMAELIDALDVNGDQMQGLDRDQPVF